MELFRIVIPNARPLTFSPEKPNSIRIALERKSWTIENCHYKTKDDFSCETAVDINNDGKVDAVTNLDHTVDDEKFSVFILNPDPEIQVFIRKRFSMLHRVQTNFGVPPDLDSFRFASQLAFTDLKEDFLRTYTNMIETMVTIPIDQVKKTPDSKYSYHDSELFEFSNFQFSFLLDGVDQSVHIYAPSAEYYITDFNPALTSEKTWLSPFAAFVVRYYKQTKRESALPTK